MKMSFVIVLMVGFAAFTVPAQDTADRSRNGIPELKPVYKEWSEKDVCRLITIDPRDSYLKLQTDDERDKFIEDYWTRLEESPEIAIKNERVERLTYAEEHFTAGALGSKTDRGRIYILWGKPEKTVYGRMRIADRDESVRFEMWTSDGRNFIFIDPEGTGDLRLIRDEDKVK